jgi:hypothetical protein
MNAKEEFISHTQGDVVKCAYITFGDDWGDEDYEADTYSLPVGYTPEEYDVFLQSIDREYHSGYGGQELYGTIWYTSGNWSSRGEYDGSEWWDYHTCPEIPESLIKC